MSSDPTDYNALIRKAQAEAVTTKNPLLFALADAVEALAAEVEAAHDNALVWVAEARQAAEERDALRAQLDNVTESVEYAYGSLDAPGTIIPTGEDIDDLGSARYNAEEYWLSVLQRTVRRGPWVEVTD